MTDKPKSALEIAVAALERIGQVYEDGHKADCCWQCDDFLGGEECIELECPGRLAREALSAIRSAPVEALADDVEANEYCWRAINGMPRDRHTVYAVLEAADRYRRERA